MIIYYEDFITDTEKTLRDVVEFMKEFDMEPNDLEGFLEDLETHRAKSLKNYKPGAISGGNKIIHHSKGISDGNKNKIDNHLINNYGDLYEKYLTRYKE